ncbi:MAG: hypothetical protein IPJ08_20435 [Burkholderiales bacterium]|nr:hypothetical protein [Burkholderiales bacterium]
MTLAAHQATLTLEFPALPSLRVPLPASTGGQPGRDDIAFELGWDHAHHGLVPPTEHLLPANPVRQGWEAGRASFGSRTLKPTRHVRKWLQLRLQAWKRGRVFEGVQVTPHYLAQIDTARCPVTRLALTHATGADTDASVDRVYNDAAYAAGNLAVMSLRANQAKGNMRWDEARTMAVLAEARTTGAGAGTADGLASAEWARMAVLMSFVTPLPHELAATLPLLVLPPNRLRLLNPIQGLQALITLQLTHPGFAARSAQLAALLPGKELRRDYQLLFHSLLPRAWDGGRPVDAQLLRERLEDAWRNPLVLRRWQRLACQISAEQAEALVQRAVARGLGGKLLHVQLHASAQATEGWALETAGYEAPTAAARAPHRAPARRVLQPELRQAAA